MYCPNCGVETVDEAKFCKDCGGSLTSNVAEGTPPSTLTQPPRVGHPRDHLLLPAARHRFYRLRRPGQQLGCGRKRFSSPPSIRKRKDVGVDLICGWTGDLWWIWILDLWPKQLLAVTGSKGLSLLGADEINISSRFRLSPRVAYIVLAALGLVGVIVLYAFDPRNPGTYPICPFLGLTGYHCPGCGTLRALHQLLHGNVIAALGYNPLTILSLPFIAYSFAEGAMKAFRSQGATQNIHPAPAYMGTVHRDRRVLGAPQRADRAADVACAIIGWLTPRTSLSPPRTPPGCSGRGVRWDRRTRPHSPPHDGHRTPRALPALRR